MDAHSEPSHLMVRDGAARLLTMRVCALHLSLQRN